MLYNSLEFLLLFLPAVLAAARLARRYVLVVLVVASLFFYAWAGHAWFVAPMIAVATIDFFIARAIAAAKDVGRARMWLIVSLAINLGLLAFFKYGPLFLTTFTSQMSPAWLALPAGISFYTFQTMSYTIDIYRKDGEPEHSFTKYLAFVSFFPHLVCGPLTRHRQLLPQLGALADGTAQRRVRSGVLLFAVGLCKKVLLADRIGALIDPNLDAVAALPAGASWLCLLGYALEIYFDFSGYSDMAVGLGRLFGIELPQNFDSPYQSISPGDFWRRWHMTLSAWLRDYLYISLGGNRKGERRRDVNVMITMMLGGMWHGARWTFLAWGAYHGALIVLSHRFSAPWSKLPVVVQRAVTLLLVVLGWVFFRAPTFEDAGDWFVGLTGLRGAGFADTTLAPLYALVVVGGAIALFTKNAWQRDLDRLAVPAQIALGVATAAAFIGMTSSSKFLYFQF